MKPFKKYLAKTLACLRIGAVFLTTPISAARAQSGNFVFLQDTKPSFRAIGEKDLKDCREWRKIFLDQSDQINRVGQISLELSAAMDDWLKNSAVNEAPLQSFYDSIEDKQKLLTAETQKLQSDSTDGFFEEEGFVEWKIPLTSFAETLGNQTLRAAPQQVGIDWKRFTLKNVVLSVRHELRYPMAEDSSNQATVRTGGNSLVASIPFRPVDRCLVAGVDGAGAVPSGEKGHLEKSLLQFSLEDIGSWASTQSNEASQVKESVLVTNVFVILDSEKFWLESSNVDDRIRGRPSPSYSRQRQQVEL